MTLQELKKNLTELMQARVGWDRAEAYAEDVTAWMARKGLRVVKD